MSQIDRVLRSNLKLRHLQMLVALDQFRHLGRAAEFLSVTQPAVSKSLAEIERMFGLALFERSTRGTEPTPYGDSVVRSKSARPNMRSISASDLDTAGCVTERNSAARPRWRNWSSATSICRWRSLRLERRTRSIWLIVVVAAPFFDYITSRL